MIYTGSFFEKKRWLGKPLSISRSQPKRTRVEELQIFAPSKELIYSFWNKSAKDEAAWAEYRSVYWQELKAKWSSVQYWLNSLVPIKNLTLLCWEKDSDDDFRCHRQLVNKLIEKFRPDCYWLNAPVAPVDFDKWEYLNSLDLPDYEIGCLTIYDDNGKATDSLPLIAETGKEPNLFSWQGAIAFIQHRHAPGVNLGLCRDQEFCFSRN